MTYNLKNLNKQRPFKLDYEEVRKFIKKNEDKNRKRI